MVDLDAIRGLDKPRAAGEADVRPEESLSGQCGESEICWGIERVVGPLACETLRLATLERLRKKSVWPLLQRGPGLKPLEFADVFVGLKPHANP